MNSIPRIVIAAPRSGGGKTTFTCGLLKALQLRGLRCAAFKCGPDYIDPLFHEQVSGAKRGNLDLFFTDEDTAKSLFVRGSEDCDIAVVEGVMGFYDGMSATSPQASSYHLAKTLQAPVVLVLDAKGASLSLAAQVQGIARFRPDANVQGVILSRCSKSLCDMVAPVIQEECGIPVLGCIPANERLAIESRHLGLVTAAEIDDLEGRILDLAHQIEQTVDLDALIALAQGAPALEAEPYRTPRLTRSPLRLAIARDTTFCFYYAENLRALEDAGVQLVPFAPVQGETLPHDIDGLYLGGGYPELHAEALEANTVLRTQVREAVAAGLPTVAECGGFMFLQQRICDPEGTWHRMAGALPGECRNLGKLRQFGYVTVTSQVDGLYGPAGTQWRAHEFHYWHSTENGADCTAKKPLRDTAWPCTKTASSLLAGYPHVYFASNPAVLEGFVGAMERFHATRTNLPLDASGTPKAQEHGRGAEEQPGNPDAVQGHPAARSDAEGGSPC